ncbi:MAG TPA: hypothetical protein VKQ71_15630 [Acidimicrobiales bacterium]|nr:hypothetical protein [Acidimicrobiales bacterium]
MSSDEELAQKRAITDSVLARARTDASYLASLQHDPVSVLTSAGLDVASAQELNELTSPETTGFRQCDRVTCIAWVTFICGNWVTWSTD